jgi:transposase
MQALERENSPEVLRALVKKILISNERLQKEIDQLKEKASLKRVQSELNIENELMVLRRIIFGKKSEKRNPGRERNQDEGDILLHSQLLLPPLKNKQTKELEKEIVCHEMTEDELRAESKLRGFKNPSADQWVAPENFYDESREVTVIERQYKEILHRRQKYKLKSEFVAEGEKQVIVTAKGADKLLPGSHYSIDFASSVVSDKYISHMPLERQTRQMESLGLKKISTKLLSNLCMTASVHLDELAQKIKHEILSCGLCVHADETPWPIQIKEQDSGYMWVISNAAGAYYRFEPTRAGEVIRETLEGYQGSVLADGYTGYTKLGKTQGIILANCWAHVRRKFFDIDKNYPIECKEILDLIDELFGIERKAKSFEELKILRKEESEVLKDKILYWLNQNEEICRAEDGMMEAIKYTKKYWIGLTKFLDDVKIPLSNNEAERTIRHAVMGRKNFYGSRNHNGADVAATLYTIIESCKKVEVDPRTFINMALKLSSQGGQLPTPLEYARQIREA